MAWIVIREYGPITLLNTTELCGWTNGVIFSGAGWTTIPGF